MCLKIIISRKYLGCYQFFLQNSHKIKQILRRIIPNIVYFIGGNRKTILAIFLFWRMLHNTYYTFHNVIYIGEVTLTVTIIENLNSFAFTQFIGKTKVRHIRTTCRTIDRKETKTSRGYIIEFTISVCHQFITLLCNSIKTYRIIYFIVC